MNSYVIYKLTQEYVNVRKPGQDFKDFVWIGLSLFKSGYSVNVPYYAGVESRAFYLNMLKNFPCFGRQTLFSGEYLKIQKVN